MILIALQVLLIALLAPGMVGLIRFFKARFQNRRGASPHIPYMQLLSLVRKDMTIARHSSWVFRLVPFVVLSTTLYLAFAVPTFAVGALPVSAANIFLVAAIIALGSVFLVMGGMDTGSSFGNMGSSREMALTTLIEPALFIVFAGMAALAGAFSLDGIIAAFAADPWLHPAPVIVLATALILVVLLENARYPVDNPATHLELTMVHEAMLLEYSGPYLAMLEYASALKLATLSLLCMNVLAPYLLAVPGVGAGALLLAGLALAGKLIVAAFGIALFESVTVKMRFYRMQEYATLAYLIALAGLIAALVPLYR